MAIGATNYPGSLDTLTELIRVVNDARTTVDTGGATNSATTINVVSAASAPSDGVAEIVSATDETVREIISYTGKTATSLTGCTRNFESSGAKAWNAGDYVYFDAITAKHHQVLADAIVAIETALGCKLIDANSFTTQSSVTVDNVFTTQYNRHLLIIEIDASTAATGLSLVMRNTTPADITTGYERPSLNMSSSSNTVTGSSATNASDWSIMTLINGATDGVSYVDLAQVRQTNKVRGRFHTSSLSVATTTYQMILGSLGLRATTAIQGFKLLPGSGTISGRYAVFGYIGG